MRKAERAQALARSIVSAPVGVQRRLFDADAGFGAVPLQLG
jgi:hypothetical protein